MTRITTHVLDTALGRPAAGVRVSLESDGEVLARARTDTDGRAGLGEAEPGRHCLMFELAEYFDGREAFYPEVKVTFDIPPGEAHCHVPLLLSPFGYSTYRGS
jgi:5-hydroxyisourate hydrolase